MTDSREAGQDARPQLIRGIGLGSATALNMIDMIGVGPFITIPLIVSAMGGPQAMLGWVLGALDGNDQLERAAEHLRRGLALDLEQARSVSNQPAEAV